MSNMDLTTLCANEELSVTETEELLEYIKIKTGMIFAPRLHSLVKKQFDNIKDISGAKDKNTFLKALTTGLKELESQALFESLTVHETMFFRDSKYFGFMEQFMIPKLIKENQMKKSLSIWIAAGSSGQEIYSILIMLYEKFPELKGWNLAFYSTDLSSKVIDKAKQGIYETHEISRGLPEEYLNKYFNKNDDKHWQVKDTYRNKITFKTSNLVKDFYADVPSVDIISCRNVLIYFNNETKKDIIERLSKKININGFLLLGQVDYINSKVPSENFEYKTEGIFPYYHRLT